jgi:hypothetical protein
MQLRAVWLVLALLFAVVDVAAAAKSGLREKYRRRHLNYPNTRKSTFHREQEGAQYKEHRSFTRSEGNLPLFGDEKIAITIINLVNKMFQAINLRD